jgi:dihydrolipoamide dehydrogenase
VADLQADLLVVGGGPGGYATAIRAGQLGIRTVLVEAGPVGGTCLNVGCIPSKALIHVAEAFAAVSDGVRGRSPFGITAGSAAIDFGVARRWKDGLVGGLRRGIAGLLARAGVQTVSGWAEMVDGKTARVTTSSGDQVRVRARHVVLATGSRPVPLPGLPFGERVLSSTDALALDAVPSDLVVVGGGYIGLELGTAFAKLGSSVTVVEAAPRILPTVDQDLSRPVAVALEGLGVRVMTSCRVACLGDEKVDVVAEDGARHAVVADRVLVTIGRAPVVDGWGLEQLDLDCDGPFVRIDDQCRTSMAGVYAVGDLTGEPMLAHRAIAQGQIVAEVIAGRPRAWEPVCIHAVVFTDPEVVTVGLTTRAATEAGLDVVEGTFPFAASGRALTTGRGDGFVKVVASADDHVVLGVHAVGAGVAELSGSFALAIEMASRLEDVAGTVHAHPTRTEAFPEAALSALGMGFHI